MHLLKEQPDGIEGTELEELYREAYMAKWTPEKIDKYRKLMTREDEILNSMREQREDAYRDGMDIRQVADLTELSVDTILEIPSMAR